MLQRINLFRFIDVKTSEFESYSDSPMFVSELKAGLKQNKTKQKAATPEQVLYVHAEPARDELHLLNPSPAPKTRTNATCIYKDQATEVKAIVEVGHLQLERACVGAGPCGVWMEFILTQIRTCKSMYIEAIRNKYVRCNLIVRAME
jgi:hypothetical protein